MPCARPAGHDTGQVFISLKACANTKLHGHRQRAGPLAINPGLLRRVTSVLVSAVVWRFSCSLCARGGRADRHADFHAGFHALRILKAQRQRHGAVFSKPCFSSISMTW